MISKFIFTTDLVIPNTLHHFFRPCLPCVVLLIQEYCNSFQYTLLKIGTIKNECYQ